MREQARNSASWIVSIMMALAFGFIAGRYSAPGNAPIPQSLNAQSIFGPTPDPAQMLVTLPPQEGVVPTVDLQPTGVTNPVVQNVPSATFVLNADGATVTHVVQEGESVFRIAAQYGVDMQTVIDFNSLIDPANIGVGQTLLIPVAADYTPPPTAMPLPTETPPPPTDLPTATETPIPTNTPTDIPTNTPIPTEAAAVSTNPVMVVVVTSTLEPTPSPTMTRVPPTEIAFTNVDDMPILLNNLTIDSFLIMDEAVRQNIREIYERGQTFGRNPRAFSKVGDSVIENPHFLARFDDPVTGYNLGEYGYLQTVIDYYQGSFGRQGMAVIRGLHSWNVNDPFWAGGGCIGGESPVECEYRLQNPSVAFIRLGSNDVGVPNSFDRNMRELVEYTIAQGIVPIIGTKADRHEGSNINNEILRQIAQDYQVPLWDFDVIAGTIPGRGLDGDGVHLNTYFAHDYTQGQAFQRGHGVHNLTALMMLDRVFRVIHSPES